jgi:hypothetical protein
VRYLLYKNAPKELQKIAKIACCNSQNLQVTRGDVKKQRYEIFYSFILLSKLRSGIKNEHQQTFCNLPSKVTRMLDFLSKEDKFEKEMVN